MPAPDWSGLVGTDGQKHSLADLSDKEAIVVCFTCNTCPYAVDYEDRLIALAKRFAAEGNKCVLVAINANKVKDDLLPAMQERAKAKGFNFPYLYDETQQVARSYGATFTPEFVVLNKERKVIYLGAMDDSPDGKNVTKRYIEDAVAATLAGKLPERPKRPPSLRGAICEGAEVIGHWSLVSCHSCSRVGSLNVGVSNANVET